MEMIKTQEAQTAGKYAPTIIDAMKDAATFRLINVSPYVIRWADGKQETVTKRRLAALQSAHPTWMADF